MGKIYAAKTNHITNPVGFYMEQIVFSWKVKECEGKKQKNFCNIPGVLPAVFCCDGLRDGRGAVGRRAGGLHRHYQ